jgi:N-acetylglucosaminyldiphosphoundecaprenol N-acetyl-beta-D-mannosaminyltransferase
MASVLEKANMSNGTGIASQSGHESGACANILGVKVDAIDTAAALASIESALEQGRKGYICAPDASNILRAQDDESHRRILNGSLLTIADSRAVVWTAWMQGVHDLHQIGGPELMLEMCRLSQSRGYRHFLYGGDEGVADQLKPILEQRFQGIKIVGTYCPPFRPLNESERKALIEQVSRTKPDLFWVGIGSPKQERFMAEYLPLLDTKIMFGVGAAFNFHSGRVHFSPRWMQLVGLSWLFRLAQEPRRLWKRYLLSIPRFTWSILLQLLRLHHYSLD